MKALSIFVSHPWLAIAAAGALAALWSWRRGLLVGVAAIGWLAYGVYEYLMFSRVLCSGECNIRVDLLVIYPILLAVTALGAFRLLLIRPCAPSSS